MAHQPIQADNFAPTHSDEVNSVIAKDVNMLQKPKSTDYPYDYEVNVFSTVEPWIVESAPAATLAEAKSLVKRHYSDVVFDDDFDCCPLR